MDETAFVHNMQAATAAPAVPPAPPNQPQLRIAAAARQIDATTTTFDGPIAHNNNATMDGTNNNPRRPPRYAATGGITLPAGTTIVPGVMPPPLPPPPPALPMPTAAPLPIAPAVAVEETWSCHKCDRRNLISKARCSSCQGTFVCVMCVSYFLVFKLAFHFAKSSSQRNQTQTKYIQRNPKSLAWRQEGGLRPPQIIPPKFSRSETRGRRGAVDVSVRQREPPHQGTMLRVPEVEGRTEDAQQRGKDLRDVVVRSEGDDGAFEGRRRPRRGGGSTGAVDVRQVR